MKKPSYPISSIDDVKVFDAAGPWTTKSGGALNVLFSLPFAELTDRYFHYEQDEVKQIVPDIRGLRTYEVSNIPEGSVGANEWHRVRNELVFASEGSMEWECEDAYGNKTVEVLDSRRGIWVPPFILHTYRTLGRLTSILVIANTMFTPENPATHDTYSRESFEELQSYYQKAR